MLKFVYEGQLTSFFKADVDVVQGQLLKIDTTKVDTLVPAGAGDDVYGIAAQHVRAGNIDNFKLDSVTHVAKHGDKVGVYTNGGVYYTDQYVGTVTKGAKLYPAAAGVLSATASGNAVAIAETAGVKANGDRIRIKSLIG
ncbi:hypothetical protein D3C72_655950 [compost metagenome]